jgi:signal transduction histidine kinase
MGEDMGDGRREETPGGGARWRDVAGRRAEARVVLAVVLAVELAVGLAVGLAVAWLAWWPAAGRPAAVVAAVVAGVVSGVGGWWVARAGYRARLAEEGRRRAGLEAERDQALRETRLKSKFVNNLSHDLRTPLNGLSVQLYLAGVALQEGDVAGALEEWPGLQAGMATAREMLERFLELGRLEWSEALDRPELFDLADLVRGLGLRFQAVAAQRGLTLTRECPAGLQLCMDRFKLERVLQVLLDNAIKFTEAGGVALTARASPDGVEVQVVDSGVGIPEAYLESIFDEFYQVANPERERGKGFGLGLCIARGLCRHFGGDVAVESVPGRGSRFTVFIPGRLRRGLGAPAGADGRGDAASPAAAAAAAGCGG